MDTDTEAFTSVIAAQRLPKSTAEEKKARSAAIQRGYQDASKVPLSTARLCFEAIELAAEVARKGNKPSVSDAGVAALMGCAGVEGAVYNVRINLPAIRNADFCAEMERDLDQLVTDARKLRDDVDRFVLEQIKAS